MGEREYWIVDVDGRLIERRLYFNAEVEEYWIVDIDGRLVGRWHSGDERPKARSGHSSGRSIAGVGGAIEVASLFDV